MRTLLIITTAALLSSTACARSSGDTPKHQMSAAATAEASPEVFAIGTALTATGAVAENSTSDSFRRGPELYVSVDVTSASTEQTIDVEWLDPRGTRVHAARRIVSRKNGYATFSSGPTHTWKPGEHRAVITIDGRRVSEKPFSLI